MKSQQATVLRAGCLVRVGYDAFCSYCLSESSLLLGDQPLTPTAKEGAYFSYMEEGAYFPCLDDSWVVGWGAVTASTGSEAHPRGLLRTQGA